MQEIARAALKEKVMDIVERLRDWNKFGVSRGDFVAYSQEAADEIERLREALVFYASFSDALPHENIAPLMIDRGNKARAALKGDE